MGRLSLGVEVGEFVDVTLPDGRTFDIKVAVRERHNRLRLVFDAPADVQFTRRAAKVKPQEPRADVGSGPVVTAAGPMRGLVPASAATGFVPSAAATRRAFQAAAGTAAR